MILRNKILITNIMLYSTKTGRLVDLPKTCSFTKALQADARIDSPTTALKNPANIIHTPRVLAKGAFSYTLPEKRKESQYLISSETALKDLGLDEDQVNDETYQKIVSGEYHLENSSTLESKGFPFPYAQAYAGWQFGLFAGQLGDGRVVNLFEVPKKATDTNRPFYELQLKGSGMTPYSRFADGKAVLRSSIREYIISEHLNALGIPSTRALSLTYLPKTVAQRHMWERCAIVSRFAELWIRLGTFDLYRWRGDRIGIKKLADYVVKELYTIGGKEFGHFSEVAAIRPDLLDDSVGELTKYDKLYYEAIVRNAYTTAMWQVYGFLNGVLNTDNTSILGLSMDFGPFSIMDRYDPNYTPNSEDHEARYGYRNTPTSIWWNLTRFGEDLAELIGCGPELIGKYDDLQINKEIEEKIIGRATKIIEVGGDLYQFAFMKKYVETFYNRLGLSHKLLNYKNLDQANEELIGPLLEILYNCRVDFNKFFLTLQDSITDTDTAEHIMALSLDFDEATSKYTRNEVIQQIEGWLKTYRAKLAESEKVSDITGKKLSEKYNPIFLPRNWILDEVYEHVKESGAQDLSHLKKLQKMSLNPYDRLKWGDELKELEEKWILQGDRGEEYSMLQCSCAS